MMSEKFGKMDIIEHFGSQFRFKIWEQVPVGTMFGLLEDNKEELKIKEYSIKQTTME